MLPAPDSDFIAQLWQLGPVFVAGAPHSARLGMEFVSVAPGRATLQLPYNPDLIGDVESGVLHGGAVTALLDQAAGLAAMSGFGRPSAVATLSLHIDYQRAATPRKTVMATAQCHTTTTHVAFVKGTAHQGDLDNPVATLMATFIATATDPKGVGFSETPS